MKKKQQKNNNNKKKKKTTTKKNNNKKQQQQQKKTKKKKKKKKQLYPSDSSNFPPLHWKNPAKGLPVPLKNWNHYFEVLSSDEKH